MGEYYSNSKNKDKYYSKKPEAFEYINTELYVFTSIERNIVSGFLVCRLLFQADQNANFAAGVGENDFLSDIFYQSMFERDIKFRSKWNTSDVAGVADLALAKANASTGSKRYLKVLVQQVDYFERGDVRRRNVEDRNLDG